MPDAAIPAGCHDSSLKIQAAAAAACELLSQSTASMQSAAEGFRSSAASRTSSRQKLLCVKTRLRRPLASETPGLLFQYLPLSTINMLRFNGFS